MKHEQSQSNELRTKSRLGDIPVQVGVPTEGAPLVLDMATSATAYFALVEAQRAGRPVPDDIGFDAAGDVTTDAGAILAGGAMRSFDRHVSPAWGLLCGAPAAHV